MPVGKLGFKGLVPLTNQETANNCQLRELPQEQVGCAISSIERSGPRSSNCSEGSIGQLFLGSCQIIRTTTAETKAIIINKEPICSDVELRISASQSIQYNRSPTMPTKRNMASGHDSDTFEVLLAPGNLLN